MNKPLLSTPTTEIVSFGAPAARSTYTPPTSKKGITMSYDTTTDTCTVKGSYNAAATASHPTLSAPPRGERRRDWPEDLHSCAYHGLAGDFVRAIEPNTESDPAAILCQFLVAFGTTVGRGPHVLVEADEHHAQLFLVIIGDSSRGRKGTSWGRVQALFSGLTDWPGVKNGLSTGEGLKYHVRDALTTFEFDRAAGRSVEVQTDPGVADKRLLAYEPEFAQVLRAASRNGNTLSATIRAAWDCGKLASLTKTDPTTATGAHVNIIAHITIDELRREITSTDIANGFVNRFLFMCARRSKELPHGGADMAPEQRTYFLEKLGRARDRARSLGRVRMTEGAAQLWAKMYAHLSNGPDGLLGAATARAEAQCLRLALIYGLLDEATEIDVPHLRAARAVWERAAASARVVFGTSMGDPIADEILRALRAEGAGGMTRTQISDLFRRHKSAERITSALEFLQRRGLAELEQHATAGRTCEVWRASSANEPQFGLSAAA